VPLSNYAGWLLTSVCLIAAFQLIESQRIDKTVPGLIAVPFHALLGPLLYLSVLFFNIAVTLVIGENFMALCGLLMYALPVVMVVVLAFLRVNRFTKEQLDDHLKDYPWSPAGRVLKQRK
jgi:putative membrane protein